MDGGGSLEGTSVLLERVRTGDQTAVESLFKRYLGPLRRWASGRLPGWARDLRDTDDLVQDTVTATLAHLNGFKEHKDGGLHAYLRQSINNRIHDEIRRVRRRPLVESAGEDVAALTPSPLESAIGRDALARYERGLARLTVAEREAVIARVELGLSYPEIAASLDKPSTDAARMTVSRALLRLAREMDRV